jgi:hypothetical protein
MSVYQTAHALNVDEDADDAIMNIVAPEGYGCDVTCASEQCTQGNKHWFINCSSGVKTLEVTILQNG